MLQILCKQISQASMIGSSTSRSLNKALTHSILAPIASSQSNFAHLDRKNFSRVIVIGGGIAGCFAAIHLLKHSMVRVEQIRMIEPNPMHTFSAISTYLLPDIKTDEEVQLALLDHLHVKSHIDFTFVKSIDAKNSTLKTYENKVLQYDFLIIACGVRDDLEQIANLREAITKDDSGVCVLSDYPNLARSKRMFQNSYGNVLFYSPSNKKRRYHFTAFNTALLYDDYLRGRSHTVRQYCNIEYFNEDEQLFPFKPCVDRLERKLQKSEIRYTANATLKEIDVERKNAVFVDNKTGERILKNYDMLIIDPPTAPLGFLQDSGLLTPNNSSINADPRTLIHRQFGNIFALGDCVENVSYNSLQSVINQSLVISKNVDKTIQARGHECVEDLVQYKGESTLPVYWANRKLWNLHIDEKLDSVGEEEPSKLAFYNELLVKPYLYSNYWMRARFLGQLGIRKPQYQQRTTKEKFDEW